MTPEEAAWAKAAIASRGLQAKRARMEADLRLALGARDRLGRDPDVVLARELRVPKPTVVAVRRILEDRVRLDRRTDRSLADELGISAFAVAFVRKEINGSAVGSILTDESKILLDRHLLDTKSDGEVAKDLDVAPVSVARVRKALEFAQTEERLQAEHRKALEADLIERERSRLERLDFLERKRAREAGGAEEAWRWEESRRIREAAVSEAAARRRQEERRRARAAVEAELERERARRVREEARRVAEAERKEKREAEVEEEAVRLRAARERLAAQRREREAAAAEALRQKVEEKRRAREAAQPKKSVRRERVKKYNSSSVTTRDLDLTEIWDGGLQWPEEDLMDWEPDMAWELGLKVCTIWRVLGRVASADALGAYRLCEEAVLFDERSVQDPESAPRP